jgi:hypothetical protein
MLSTMFIFTASATIESKWMLREDSVMLFGSTNINNPTIGKSAIIAIAYDKSFFSCKLSVAFITMEGSTLGNAASQKSSSAKKNQLTFTINNKKFTANGETKLNQYSNGLEVIGYFDEAVITELAKPSNIRVSIGSNNPPRMVFKSLDGIGKYMEQARRSC